MKRVSIIGGVLVVMVLAAAWWFSTTQVVKRRTVALLSTLTLDRGSGKTTRQFATYSLNRLLAAEVVLEGDSIREANGTFERAELESAFSWVANQAKETRFELTEIHSISIKEDQATVEITLEGLVQLPSYRPADGAYDATFEWIKDKDGWRLTSARWSESGGGELVK